MFWTIAGGVCIGILAAYRIIHAKINDWKALGIVIGGLLCIGFRGFLIYFYFYTEKYGTGDLPSWMKITLYIILGVGTIYGICGTIYELFIKKDSIEEKYRRIKKENK